MGNSFWVLWDNISLYIVIMINNRNNVTGDMNNWIIVDKKACLFLNGFAALLHSRKQFNRCFCQV